MSTTLHAGSSAALCVYYCVLQADVCHAYHVVRRNGIPEERVILMSYGDAADSRDNPVRGTLFK